jgi:hypothetical protein
MNAVFIIATINAKRGEILHGGTFFFGQRHNKTA